MSAATTERPARSAKSPEEQMRLREDSKPLSSIIPSPRAQQALAAAGYKTIGDIRSVPLSKLGEVKGVGQVALQKLASYSEAPVVDQPEEPGEWEEGPHPLVCHSPHRAYCLVLMSGDTITTNPRTGAHRVVPPVAIEFEDHQGELTRKAYLTLKYQRDPVAITNAERNNEAWRQEAAAYLRKIDHHGRKFFLMTD